MDGVGLVPRDVFLAGGAVPGFWLIELALISLKGSAVSSSRFWGVYEFSMSLGNPLALAVFSQFSSLSRVRLSVTP